MKFDKYFISSLLLLMGCSSDEPKQSTDDVNIDVDIEEPATAEEDVKWETTYKIDLSANEKPVMKGLNEFGYKLMTEYAKSSEDGSFNVSPISVSTYLSMMANATAGDTHEQILSALGATDMDDLNSLNEKLMHYLPCEQNGSCLEINNRIWLSNKYTASKTLTETVKTMYNAEVESVDFTLPTTVPAINKWVSEKTHGLIPGILYGNWYVFVALDQTSANTVYFKGEWDSKFDKKLTNDGDFTNHEGRKVNVDMMHKVIETSYAELNGIQMVKINYKNRLNYMELYLPTEDTPSKDIVTVITPEVQEALWAKMKTYEVTLSMPRFKTRSEQIPLKETLTNLGLTKLSSTDFSPLGIVGTSPFELVHQTYISVDEEGTELAAVTAGWSSSQGDVEYETPKVKVDFDRPFMYIVRNYFTGAILMAGVVTNPKE